MKVQRHPNYMQLLLLAGAKVVSPILMKPGKAGNGGRMWEANAKVRLKGFDFILKAKFFGKDIETQETAEANLNIEYIRMHVEGGKEADFMDFTRASWKAVFLYDGIYVCPDWSDEINEIVRKMLTYNNSQYVGIPNAEERNELTELGYKRIVAW